MMNFVDAYHPFPAMRTGAPPAGWKSFSAMRTRAPQAGWTSRPVGIGVLRVVPNGILLKEGET